MTIYMKNGCSLSTEVFGVDLFRVVFSHRMSWVGSVIELCLLLEIILL